MEAATWIFIGICVIGAILAGGVAVIACLAWWYAAIPIICAYAGGWMGFLFGVGLDVVIWVIASVIGSVMKSDKAGGRRS